MTLKEGMKAPEFTGTDQEGREVSLRDFRGKKLVLYFYPKDNTPGCTAEACNLRDNHELFLDRGFAVVGVSPDTIKSHSGFAAKYSLPFPLISDADRKIMNAYGVYGEKKMYGKTVMGVMRTTFIIDENGMIEKIIGKVDTAGHASQILNLYKQ